MYSQHTVFFFKKKKCNYDKHCNIKVFVQSLSLRATAKKLMNGSEFESYRFEGRTICFSPPPPLNLRPPPSSQPPNAARISNQTCAVSQVRKMGILIRY